MKAFNQRNSAAFKYGAPGKKTQGGYTLLDLVFWFAVVLIVLPYALAKFGISISNGKTSGERETFQVVLGQIKKVSLGGGGSAPGDITQTLIKKGGVFIKPWIVGGTTVVNSFNGNVGVIDNGTTFTVSSANYPDGICSDLVLSPYDAISIDINGTTYPTSTPISLQMAVAACSATNSNTISITSMK
jgi:hypothetical protein